MYLLVVKEDVRAEIAQNVTLGDPTEEEDLVNAHVPSAQGANDSFMGGGVSRRHEGGADGRLRAWEGSLDVGKRF